MTRTTEKDHYLSFSMKTHRSRHSSPLLISFALTIILSLGVAPAAAQAQSSVITGADVQKIANAVLTLMGYSLTPDVTTGSLSIADVATESPGFSMTSLGGGFTFSKARPLYLEGTVAYSYYDPSFVVSDGSQVRSIPVKWNSISSTAGIGWDFPIAEELALRPMFNFSLGRVESDLLIAQRVIENNTGQDIDFLNGGRLDALGVGGSLMLDYERYRRENEIDVELRYTNIYLQSISNSSKAVSGSADSQSLSLWSRWRASTGLTALHRPVRYVLEFSHTQFLGDLRGAMGFNWLSALGAGFELDSSAHNIILTRTRLLARYKYGDGVQGWSIGLAVSF